MKLRCVPQPSDVVPLTIEFAHSFRALIDYNGDPQLAGRTIKQKRGKSTRLCLLAFGPSCFWCLVSLAKQSLNRKQSKRRRALLNGGDAFLF